MIVKLKTGTFEGESIVDESKGYLDKKAMLVYSGKFESMDGPVEIKDEDIDKLIENHNSVLKKLGRLAEGISGYKFSPPIQLDHSTSAKDTVGRLVGNLEHGEHEVDGKKMKALMGTVRVLGKENIEKVQDGRWTHLSIGADLGTHKISELTITPFPAAADASLLSARLAALATQEVEKLKVERITARDEIASINTAMQTCKDPAEIEKYLKQIDTLNIKIKDLEDKIHGLDKSIKLSEGDNMDYKSMKEKMSMYEKCKKHLMDEKKMSEEDAEKHMSEAKDEDMKKMAADQDEKDKKLYAEKAEEDKKLADEKVKDDAKKEEEKKAAMSARKETFVRLYKGVKSAESKINLAAKSARLKARLSKLKADAKITPSELKKINLSDLIQQNDTTVEAVFKSYEDREALPLAGLYGSNKALTSVELFREVKKVKFSKEEQETLNNMSFTKKAHDAQLGAAKDKDKQTLMNAFEQDSHHLGEGDGGAHQGDDQHEKMWAEMKKLMDEGKHDEAKEHLKKHMSLNKMAEPADGDFEKQMSTLASEQKEMHTELENLAKLAGTELGIEASDLA